MKRRAIKREAAGISQAAELVANNVDLLTEILSWLPTKSVFRFKSVSKQWLSLLSDSEFATNHSTRSLGRSSISSLYFCSENKLISQIALPGCSSHLSPLSFLNSSLKLKSPIIKVIHSSHGLLLCHIMQTGSIMEERKYIVGNPTTKKHRLLPNPDGLRYLDNGFLAFDPKKSSDHYKVVLLSKARIDIYSSQSLCWKKVLLPHHQKYDGKRAFWNGAIHWLTSDNFLKRFDVDAEEIIAMPNPQAPQILSLNNIMYFGECRGCLILIRSRFRCCPSGFRILEMEKDYSGWVVKCRVNLRPLISEYPDMRKKDFWFFTGYAILHAVEGEDERGIALFISTPRRIIAYYPKDKAWEELLDLAAFGLARLDFTHYVLPSIETLFPV